MDGQAEQQVKWHCTCRVVLYIADEEHTERFWGPCPGPGPCRGGILASKAMDGDVCLVLP